MEHNDDFAIGFDEGYASAEEVARLRSEQGECEHGTPWGHECDDCQKDYEYEEALRSAFDAACAGFRERIGIGSDSGAELLNFARAYDALKRGGEVE